MNVNLSQQHPKALSEGQVAALVSLLADEDPEVHRMVRDQILMRGQAAAEWVRLHLLSADARMRRRSKEILSHLERQSTDNRFLAFCLNQGEDFDVEQAVWLLAQTRYPEIHIGG